MFRFDALTLKRRLAETGTFYVAILRSDARTVKQRFAEQKCDEIHCKLSWRGGAILSKF